MRPVPGAILGKYRILRTVAEGGMGTIYEAIHEGLGTKVALKFLHPELARRPGFVGRFLQEARVAAQLKSPHIVPVTDVEQHGQGAYLVMELLTGESLQSRLDREKRLPPNVAIDVSIQVLAGLSVAHGAGVVHRDLKPDNVFLAETQEGTRAVILDFGIAKLRDAPMGGLTRPGATMGTPEYMAPEQAHSAETVDVRADLYALGVMLYEMLAGRRPATGEDPKQIAAFVTNRQVTHLSAIDPSLPEGLVRVVHQAMEPFADGRFSSADEMLRALLSHASVLSAAGHQAVASVVSPGPRSSRLPSTLPPETPGARTAERAPLPQAFSPSPPVVAQAPAGTHLGAPPREAMTPSPGAATARVSHPPPVAPSPPPPAAAYPPPGAGYTGVSHAPKKRGANPLLVGLLAAALGGVVVFLIANAVGKRDADSGPPDAPPTATGTVTVAPVSPPPSQGPAVPGTPIPPLPPVGPGKPTGSVVVVGPPPSGSASKDAGAPDAATSHGLPFPPIPVPSGFPPLPSKLPPIPSGIPGLPPINIPGFPQ